MKSLLKDSTTQTPDENALNVIAKDLTKEQRKELDLEDNGVLVETIGTGPAQKAGIRQGDHHSDFE